MSQQLSRSKDSTVHKLFYTPVYQGHIDPPEGLHEMLQEKYKQCHKAAWASESNLSTGELGMDLMKEPLVAEVINVMMGAVIEYWDQHLHFAPAQIEPTSCWSNIHQKGDWTGEHSHSSGMFGCHIASVYYLEKGEGGDIQLCDPLDYIRRLTPLQEDHGDAIISETLPTRTGDFLLFPGWIRHRTEFATSRRQAISINFNGNIV